MKGSMTHFRDFPARLALGCAALLLVPRAGQAQRACRVTEVTVSPPDAQVRVGATQPFLVYPYNAAGDICDNARIIWISSNRAVATVDENGTATGLGVGITTITARTGTGASRREGRATLQVTAGGANPVAQTVPPPGVRVDVARPPGPGGAAVLRQPPGEGTAEGLLMDPQRVLLVRGEHRTLDYRAVKADGTNAAPVPVVFTIQAGGERIAAVDSFGTVSSLGDAGTATVLATVPGSSRIPQKIVSVEVRADSIRFNRPRLSLSPGVAETLSLYIPAQERAANPVGFQFTSDNLGVVRAHPVLPIVEAVGPGTARVRAQSAYYDVVATISVHRPVSRLVIQPAESLVTIAIGQSLSLQVQAQAEDGAPVPEAPLTWGLPDTAVAVFDTTTRVLRGVRVGQTQLLVSAPVTGDRSASRNLRIRVVAGGLAASRARLGLPAGGRAGIEVAMLDDQRRPIGPASDLTWTSTADSVAAMRGTEIVAGRPGRARLVGRTPWDSTVAIEVAVVGDVVITAQRENRYELYMLWSGGPPIQLTRDTLVKGQTAWSPDLMRLAFVGYRDPSNTVASLYVMNTDGSNRAALTTDSASLRFPTFVRPAGEQIVFESSRGGRSQIWVLDLASRQTRQITSNAVPATQPSVSPDGRRVAYVTARETTAPGRMSPGIYEIGLDGTGERPLVTGTNLAQPAYAPDGQSLLFLRAEGSGRDTRRRIWRVRVGAPLDSATAITPERIPILSYAVSADGSVIACTIIEPGPGNTQSTRVELFNVGTQTFQPIAGMLPQDRLSSPALRPAPASAAAATAGTPPPR